MVVCCHTRSRINFHHRKIYIPQSETWNEKQRRWLVSCRKDLSQILQCQSQRTCGRKQSTLISQLNTLYLHIYLLVLHNCMKILTYKQRSQRDMKIKQPSAQKIHQCYCLNKTKCFWMRLKMLIYVMQVSNFYHSMP